MSPGDGGGLCRSARPREEAWISRTDSTHSRRVWPRRGRRSRLPPPSPARSSRVESTGAGRPGSGRPGRTAEGEPGGRRHAQQVGTAAGRRRCQERGRQGQDRQAEPRAGRQGCRQRSRLVRRRGGRCPRLRRLGRPRRAAGHLGRHRRPSARGRARQGGERLASGRPSGPEHHEAGPAALPQHQSRARASLVKQPVCSPQGRRELDLVHPATQLHVPCLRSSGRALRRSDATDRLDRVAGRWSVDLCCRDDEAITVVEATVLARRVEPGRLTLGGDNGSAPT